MYEYKYELQNLSQDMQLLKMDYFAARRREQQASRRPTFSPGVSQHVYPEDDEFFPPNGDQGSGFDFDKGSDADRAGKHDISEQKEEKESIILLLRFLISIPR